MCLLVLLAYTAGMFFARIYLVLVALRSLTSIMAKFREATIKCNSEIPDFTNATGADKYKTI